MEKMKKVIGAFEKVLVSGMDNLTFTTPEVVAKIDTGAFSGVIHAENITETDGILQFDLLGDEKLRLETRNFRTRKVRTTHGGVKKRYLVSLKISIDGEEYETLLGLDDRRKMRFEMLLGRAFLNKFEVMVDTHKNIELDKEWKKMGVKQ
jgi:hypothetical protein